MAREAGAAVTSSSVRRQFVDGDTVCSIIDWEMATPATGRMTSAELLEVSQGRIVRGELIYDAEALRRAMAGGRERGDVPGGAGCPRALSPVSGELQLHCYRIVGSLQDAEDLVQETLLACLAWA